MKVSNVENNVKTSTTLGVHPHMVLNIFVIPIVFRQMLACTPDLISLVEVESGEPVTVDELRYGLRVAILALPVPLRMSTPRALEVVGPQAFGFSKDEATYAAVDEYTVDTYPWLAAKCSKMSSNIK